MQSAMATNRNSAGIFPPTDDEPLELFEMDEEEVIKDLRLDAHLSSTSVVKTSAAGILTGWLKDYGTKETALKREVQELIDPYAPTTAAALTALCTILRQRGLHAVLALPSAVPGAVHCGRNSTGGGGQCPATNGRICFFCSRQPYALILPPVPQPPLAPTEAVVHSQAASSSSATAATAARPKAVFFPASSATAHAHAAPELASAPAPASAPSATPLNVSLSNNAANSTAASLTVIAATTTGRQMHVSAGGGGAPTHSAYDNCACNRSFRSGMTSLSSLSGDVVYVVEMGLREMFRAAPSTVEYGKLVESLPEVWVGPLVSLLELAARMCGAMAINFRLQGLDVPPWRRRCAVLARWELRTCILRHPPPPLRQPRNGAVQPHAAAVPQPPLESPRSLLRSGQAPCSLSQCAASWPITVAPAMTTTGNTSTCSRPSSVALQPLGAQQAFHKATQPLQPKVQPQLQRMRYGGITDQTMDTAPVSFAPEKVSSMQHDVGASNRTNGNDQIGNHCARNATTMVLPPIGASVAGADVTTCPHTKADHKAVANKLAASGVVATNRQRGVSNGRVPDECHETSADYDGGEAFGSGYGCGGFQKRQSVSGAAKARNRAQAGGGHAVAGTAAMVGVAGAPSSAFEVFVEREDCGLSRKSDGAGRVAGSRAKTPAVLVYGFSLSNGACAG